MSGIAEQLAARLAAGPLVLDGALGTQLERLDVAAPAPLWSAAALFDAPQAVLRIHEAYVQAGADIVVANTFRTNPRTLREAHRYADGAAVAALAVGLARKAAGRRDVLVAASVGPAEDCYSPQRVPSERELHEEHAVNASWLARAGPDLLWIETIGTTRESLAAARAARNEGLPFVISWIVREDGRLLGDEPLAAAVEAVAPLGPLALGVNCVPARGLAACLRLLRRHTPAAMVAYGHIGNAIPLPGWSYAHGAAPAEYARAASAWLDLGARVVGGCCGTSPAHVRALRGLVDARRRPPAPGPGTLV